MLEPWNIVFLVGLIVYMGIRHVFIERTKGVEKVLRRIDALEKVLLVIVSLGALLAPVLYLFTPLLGFADYSLPALAPWCGTVVMITALWLFWRSHTDLGLNWSVSLEVRKDHSLINHGVYRSIRHPMYLSIWLFSLAQALLLQNWLAGWSALVTLAPLYFVRVPREEAMMCEHFGDQYREYMAQTGRLLPEARVVSTWWSSPGSGFLVSLYPSPPPTSVRTPIARIPAGDDNLPMASLGTFASTVRTLFKALRYVGLVFTVLAAWFLGKEVFDIYQVCAAISPAFGVGFLVVCGFLFYLAIVRPARRYLRVPPAVRPPDLPGLKGDNTLRAKHLRARARGIERYLTNLLRNPNLKDSRAEIQSALDACGELQNTLGGDFEKDRERVIRFEHERVDPLLQKLDDQARQVIRQESLGVAVATAVSPSGAIDAFVVLWRNVNLVARIAELYYGRPGIRGTFLVLADVSFAAVVASQVQGIAEKGVQTAGGFFGKAASPFAGPVVDGVINGLVTMRIGYLAMGRCRAFQAFTERSVANFLRSAFQEAAKQSAGLASDVVTKVGTPILKMPVDAGKKIVDWVSESVRGWFGSKEGPEPSQA